MYLKLNRLGQPTLLALGTALSALSCTLTHSLDDLKGGSALAATGGMGGNQSGASGTAGGGAGDAGEAGGGAGGAANGGTNTGGSAGGGGSGGSNSEIWSIVAPADGDAMGWLSAIQLQFSDNMNPDTVTVDTASAVCGKTSVQLSSDHFKSCIQMAAAPTWNLDNSVATFTPASRLTVGATYELRVTTDVTNASGHALSGAYTVTLTGIYSHTLNVTSQAATGEFLPEEKIGVNSGYTLYAAWDAANLYLGIDGSNISNNQASTEFVSYFGTDGVSSSKGMTIGSQTASLNFVAAFGMTWVGDNTQSSLSALQYTNAWQSNVESSSDSALTGWLKSRFANLVQFRIPLNRITTGSPNAIAFASALLYTQTTESTYATEPPNSFSAGGYKRFDLSGHTLPKDSPTVTP